TGSIDAVIRPEGWNRGHVTDIKSKDGSVIDAMKRGQKSYEMNHYYQVQTYLGFLQDEKNYMDLYWDYTERVAERDDVAFMHPDLYGLTGRPETCSILAVSRDRPRHTHEFDFSFDEEAWEKGTNLLTEWKKKFMADELPARDKDWRWLEQPCGYCDVKRLCKADVKAGV